jgi:hypothetical protein
MDVKVTVNSFAGERFEAIPISLSDRVLGFFALYRPSKFEFDIIKCYRDLLPTELALVLDIQVASFNRMRRLLNYEVSFVVFAHSTAKLLKTVPKLNNHSEKHNVASMRASCIDGNLIKCKIETYDGVVYKIKFSSSKGNCYPTSDYYFDNIKLL